jgi:hypothetical protein
VHKNNVNDDQIPNENQVVNENRLEIENMKMTKIKTMKMTKMLKMETPKIQPKSARTTKLQGGVDDGQSTIDDDDTIVEEPTVKTIDDETEHDDLRRRMNLKYGERKHGHELRPRRPRDYDHIHAQLKNVVMAQHSIKKGLKIFGEAGADAVVSEMQQLHDRSVIEPKKANMLTRDEKHKALQYLMFLEKKSCGRIKGRGCADGRKQRVYKTKEETSVLTVAVEALMLSSIIDAKERRYVVTDNIPGAFMQADMAEVIHMKLEGPLAKLLLTRVDPILYKKYIVTEKGKPVLYVQLMKALYGTLQAALLFWEDLIGHLLDWGFELNPYDWCVTDKMVIGKQCTILWHVDDLKISHFDKEVVEDILRMLNERYGKEAPVLQKHKRKDTRVPGDDVRLQHRREGPNHHERIHPGDAG